MSLRLPVLTEFSSPRAHTLLSELDVLVTGWECPLIDAAVLDLAPKLRLIAHAGGTVKPYVDPEVWRRGVTVTSAAEANARPVAEFTLGCILLSGKKASAAAHELSQRRAPSTGLPGPRCGKLPPTVGIIGASRVGRLVLELLRPFNFRLLLATPSCPPTRPGPRRPAGKPGRVDGAEPDCVPPRATAAGHDRDDRARPTCVDARWRRLHQHGAWRAGSRRTPGRSPSRTDLRGARRHRSRTSAHREIRCTACPM